MNNEPPAPGWCVRLLPCKNSSRAFLPRCTPKLRFAQWLAPSSLLSRAANSEHVNHLTSHLDSVRLTIPRLNPQLSKLPPSHHQHSQRNPGSPRRASADNLVTVGTTRLAAIHPVARCSRLWHPIIATPVKALCSRAPRGLIRLLRKRRDLMGLFQRLPVCSRQFIKLNNPSSVRLSRPFINNPTIYPPTRTSNHLLTNHPLINLRQRRLSHRPTWILMRLALRTTNSIKETTRAQ